MCILCGIVSKELMSTIAFLTDQASPHQMPGARELPSEIQPVAEPDLDSLAEQ